MDVTGQGEWISYLSIQNSTGSRDSDIGRRNCIMERANGIVDLKLAKNGETQWYFILLS